MDHAPSAGPIPTAGLVRPQSRVPGGVRASDVTPKRAAVYPGFSPIPSQPDDATAGPTPAQSANDEVYDGGRFTVDYALGDSLITHTLLGIYVAGKARNADLRRGATDSDVSTVARVIYKFYAFGVLKKTVHGGSRGTSFELDEKHPLHADLVAYLATLDRFSPTVRILMDVQSKSKRVAVSRTDRSSTPKGWR